VPQQAVGFDQQGEYVMVVDADDTVERRGVEQGPISDGMRVITKGLKGDEQVIVKGLLRAIPGRKVTPETEHTSASAATPPSQPASSPQTGKPDTTEGSSAPAQSQ
jgi:hypothetical protein